MLVVVILKAIVGWLVLMFVGTNLIGLVVRGFFHQPDMVKLKAEADPFVKDLISGYNRTNLVMTSVFGVVLLAYLWALIYFWNLGVAFAGLMIVLARIPDLRLEIKTGDKNSWKNAPKGVITVLTTLLNWGSLLVLFLSLN